MSEELLRTEIGYLGRDQPAGADAGRGLPARRARASDRARRLHDRAVGVGGVGRTEDGRARHEEVGAGGTAARNRVWIDATVDLQCDVLAERCGAGA